VKDHGRFNYNGREYRYWVTSGHVSVSGPAIISNARWIAEVSGIQYGLFEASYVDFDTPEHRADLESRIVKAVRELERSSARQVS
jgi:hypothetical protein